MKRKRTVLLPIAATILAFVLAIALYRGFSSNSTNDINSPKEEEEPVQTMKPPDYRVSVDAAVRYQTIDNFGASDAWSMDPIGKHWTEDNKNRVADLLFSREKGIGLSAWRFNIGAGSTETDQSIIPDPWRRAEAFKMSEDGEYDWSKQAGQQWFLQAAKDRGVDTLIAFVNSPPVWMTKNGHAQPDPDVGSTNLKEGYEDEFAAFLVDVLERFKQEGLEFDYISPINEPTWDWNRAHQEGNRYNNDDLKRVILELHRQLKASGLDAQISAPDGVEITALLDDEYYRMFAGGGQYEGGANKLGTGKYREYIKDLLGDPELKEAVGNKIASHSYWSDYSNPGDDRLGKLRELLDQNLKSYDPEAKYWVTEYCLLGDYGPGRDLGIEPALHVARTIHFDLTEANAAAWQWWTAVSKVDYKDGLIYTDYQREGDEQNILTSKILWTLGNYSKFIRPGAERVSLAGLDERARSGLLGSAYVHEGEGTVTVVFVNDGDTRKQVSLSLNGVNLQPATALSMYVTSGDRDLARAEDIPVNEDGTFEAVIPPRSIVTLTTEGNGTVTFADAAVSDAAVAGNDGALETPDAPASGASGQATGGDGQYAGYLFAYFTGEGTPDGEQIYFALSEGNDPLSWRELNGGKPVIVSDMGEKGLRDPFIIRSHDGGKFYMIATDLKIHGDGNWGRAHTHGSRSIMVWESDDLVNWSEQRMAEVSPKEAGNTWAPEAFYDEQSGEYVVFWASRLFADESREGDAYQKIMYSKTRDFRTFTEPQVYMDYGYSIIDTTMIAHNGRLYRFTKDERDFGPMTLYGKTIFQEASDGVFGSEFEMIKQGVQGIRYVEGPTVFKSNTEDKWYLFVDEFGGRGYIPLETTNLDSGEWKVSAEYRLPRSPRHGTVIPVTQAEYDALSAKYGAES